MYILKFDKKKENATHVLKLIKSSMVKTTKSFNKFLATPSLFLIGWSINKSHRMLHIFNALFLKGCVLRVIP